MGKQANCQVAASLHYVGPEGHFPLAMRLYLPKTWVDDPERLDRAGVPAEARTLRTKGQIILDQLDRVRSEGLAGRVMVADAGYGVSGEFRDGLTDRGMHYVVGVTEEMVVFQAEPRWGRPGGRQTGTQGPLGDPLEAGRRLTPADEPEGAGGQAPPVQGDLAGGDQGPDVGPLRLGAGVAGRRLGRPASARAPSRCGC